MSNKLKAFVDNVPVGSATIRLRLQRSASVPSRLAECVLKLFTTSVWAIDVWHATSRRHPCFEVDRAVAVCHPKTPVRRR